MRTGIYLCLAAGACLGQTARLEGDVIGMQATDLSHLTVRLAAAGQNIPEQAVVSVTGSFRFAHLANGNYTLSVVDEAGNEITREQVEVTPANPEIKVELPEDPAGQRPGGAVSVAQLRHKPDRRAVREWIAAGKRSEAGDYRGAAALLEKAVAHDPQFAEAHGNLGAQYVRMNQSARAVPEFERAIALDPASAMFQSNLALALAKTGRLEEAAGWARRSLQVDSTNALGHYVLGCLLLENKATRAEAFRHLEVAAATLPAARTTLDAARGATTH